MNASQTAYLGELYAKTDAERSDVVITHLKVLAHAFERGVLDNIDYTLAAGACRYAAECIGDRPVAPLTGLTPTKSGFYWAQWRKAVAGTRDAAELTPSDEWQPVQVFENALDEQHPEYLMVEVGGVEKAQGLDCFVWGPAISAFRQAEDEPCLSPSEQKAQGSRCGCRGADDYCVCQNVTDATTRALRASRAKGSA